MRLNSNMIECMLFLRDTNEGLGLHSFGRIPVLGENISLSSEGVVYKVTLVHHVGFSSNHVAELYVVKIDDIQ